MNIFNQLRRFERAVRKDELAGLYPPDEATEIRKEYQKSIKELRAAIKELQNGQKNNRQFGFGS